MEAGREGEREREREAGGWEGGLEVWRFGGLEVGREGGREGTLESASAMNSFVII